MTEHKDPEHFPEHLRPFLLPLPETRWEALFLLRSLSDVNLAIRARRADSGSDETIQLNKHHPPHAAT